RRPATAPRGGRRAGGAALGGGPGGGGGRRGRRRPRLAAESGDMRPVRPPQTPLLRHDRRRPLAGGDSGVGGLGLRGFGGPVEQPVEGRSADLEGAGRANAVPTLLAKDLLEPLGRDLLRNGAGPRPPNPDRPRHPDRAAAREGEILGAQETVLGKDAGV